MGKPRPGTRWRKIGKRQSFVSHGSSYGLTRGENGVVVRIKAIAQSVPACERSRVTSREVSPQRRGAIGIDAWVTVDHRGARGHHLAGDLGDPRTRRYR